VPKVSALNFGARFSVRSCFSLSRQNTMITLTRCVRNTKIGPRQSEAEEEKGRAFSVNRLFCSRPLDLVKKQPKRFASFFASPVISRIASSALDKVSSRDRERVSIKRKKSHLASHEEKKKKLDKKKQSIPSKQKKQLERQQRRCLPRRQQRPRRNPGRRRRCLSCCHPPPLQAPPFISVFVCEQSRSSRRRCCCCFSEVAHSGSSPAKEEDNNERRKGRGFDFRGHRHRRPRRGPDSHPDPGDDHREYYLIFSCFLLVKAPARDNRGKKTKTHPRPLSREMFFFFETQNSQIPGLLRAFGLVRPLRPSDHQDRPEQVRRRPLAGRERGGAARLLYHVRLQLEVKRLF